MKLALLAILFVPVLASAANSELPEPEQAKIVSYLLVDGRDVLTYFNEVTEQVCTYANSTNPALTCVNLHALSDDAQANVKERAASIR